MMDSFGYVVMVVLGIGLLIFIHEMGHFLCAKAAGVRVHTFSLGFGTRLLGWRRGDTDYRLSLLPIGGYVKMSGEDPGEGDRTDPRSLARQSVPWRFLIFSGGVLMNLLFALIVFPLVFSAGVEFTAPVIGEVIPGLPAWRAGIVPGDRVLEINGKTTYSFDQLRMEAALSGRDGLQLRIRHQDGRVQDYLLVAERHEGMGIKIIGARPETVHTSITLTAQDGPARRAGLRDGDRLVAIAGRPYTVESWNAWLSAERQKDRGAWRKKYAEIPLVVLRDGKETRVSLRPEFRPDEEHPKLGVYLLRNRVRALRSASLAGLALEPGDILRSLESADRSRPLLDPEEIREALTGAGEGSEFLVERVPAESEKIGNAPLLRIPVPKELTGAAGAERFATNTVLDPDTLSGRLRIQAGGAAWRAGMRDGDRMLSFAGRPWKNWNEFTAQVRKAGSRQVPMEWQPAGSDAARVRKLVSAEPVPEPVLGFGLRAEFRNENYKVDGVLPSLVAGGRHSIDTLRQLWVMMKRIFGGSVSSKNLGGIITISRVSYDRASRGWARFLYFLAILSLNLAFINILPIPVLDGGHLLFVLIEGIKGSPVSERVMGYAQLLGLVMVLALMIFVTYNDLVHLFR
ncbi:MAG: RIP metalloprotease RseP [Planctomycetota bacterium]